MTSPARSEQALTAGAWLGVDLGSKRNKIASFCLIETCSDSGPRVHFELGRAADPYPHLNTREALLDSCRAPTYLRASIEEAVRQVLSSSRLTARWLESTAAKPSAVSIDAPVALATGAGCRLTESASTETFRTPSQQTFERLLAAKADPYLRVNVFWKCVGFTVFRYFSEQLGIPRSASQQAVAALTCEPGQDLAGRPRPRGRLRETFPSDVYKRANGTVGTLPERSKQILSRLTGVPWQPAGHEQRGQPSKISMDRLRLIQEELHNELGSQTDKLRAMGKRGGAYGDLWDAFTCAFTACCEDHGLAKLQGWNRFEAERDRLLCEGAILTVHCA